MTVDGDPIRSAHRASYTLELGVWHATCRECGFRVSDPVRRRAASVYRVHIQAMYAVEPAVLDLSEKRGDPGLLGVRVPLS